MAGRERQRQIQELKASARLREAAIWQNTLSELPEELRRPVRGHCSNKLPGSGETKEDQEKELAVFLMNDQYICVDRQELLAMFKRQCPEQKTAEVQACATRGCQSPRFWSKFDPATCRSVVYK